MSAADRYNRQLSQSERTWAYDKAAEFAAYYESTTGKVITADQAQQMLLSNGYRVVDSMASNGPGGDTTALKFINENSGGLFAATAAERNNAGVLTGKLTPEQNALPGSQANPAVGLAIAGGLATAGLAPGAGAAVAYGQELWSAYKTAQAGYSLTTAALTGSVTTGGLYVVGAALGAGLENYWSGTPYDKAFGDRFSYGGLAVAATAGAYMGIYKTSMFKWAEIPNNWKNWATVPGAVIQSQLLLVGATNKGAVQKAVKSSKGK